MINKKGFTLMELMVSIGLIAIIMVFLVELLVDINYDRLNEAYASKNQFNRAEIVKTIQNDLDGKSLNRTYGSTVKTSNDNEEITTTTITFEINSGNDSSLKIIQKTGNANKYDVYFQYTSTEGKTTKWTLESNNPETHVDWDNIYYEPLLIPEGDGPRTGEYLVTINIPIVVDNTIEKKETNQPCNLPLKDSALDNITLSFYGNGVNSFDVATDVNSCLPTN